MKTTPTSQLTTKTAYLTSIVFLTLLFLLGTLGERAKAQSVPGAPPWGSNYQLVWSQDFSTMSTLSVSANGPCGTGGTTWMATKPGGGNWFSFIPPSGNLDPFGIGSGYLDIRVQQNGATNNGFDGYTGGLLASVDNDGNGFSQQYGYFECSMWCPGSPNTWPAFWLLNVGSVNDPTLPYCSEIDVTESYGNWGTGENQTPPGQPNNDSVTWHQWGENGNPTTANSSYASEPNMTSGYHTYGVDIEPTTTTWYYDRSAIWSAPTIAESKTPMFVLVNLALGGGNYNNNSNPPTGYNWDLTPNPTDLKVKYIAVWASPNSPNFTGGGGGGTNLLANDTYEVTCQLSSLAMAATGASNGSAVEQQTYTGTSLQKWTLNNLGSNVVELTNPGSTEALEVPGSSTSAGQALDVSAYTGGTNQQWTIAAASTGFYEIVNVNSGQEVNDAGNSMSNNGTLCQWYAGNYSNGVWAFASTDGGGGGGGGSGVIANGTYEVTCQLSGLAMAANGTSNGSAVQQQTYTGSTEQQWTVNNLGSSVVELTNPGSSEALEVPGSSTSAGQALDVSAYTGGTNQQWNIEIAGTGYYQIINVHSGMVVNDGGNSMSSGASLIQWNAGTSSNEVWAFASTATSGLIPNGTYKFTSQLSGLAIAANGTTNGSAVLQQTYTAANTQKWTVTNLGSNVVEMVNPGTTEALEVPGASTSAGQALDVSAYTGATNQQWTIANASTGYYEIVNVNSGQEVNDAGNSMSNNGTLCQWTAGNYPNGVWAYASP